MTSENKQRIRRTRLAVQLACPNRVASGCLGLGIIAVALAILPRSAPGGAAAIAGATAPVHAARASPVNHQPAPIDAVRVFPPVHVVAMKEGQVKSGDPTAPAPPGPHIPANGFLTTLSSSAAGLPRKPETPSASTTGGGEDSTDDYQLDDGSGSIEIGIPAGGVNILWFTRYTVLPGLSNIRTVNAAWGGTAPPGSPAHVGLYSDPNGDGTPTDSVVLANLLVVTSDEGTNVVNKYNINDVVIGPNGTNFFTFAHRGLTVVGEYPARGDATAPIPTNRCWIAVSAPTSPPTGAMLIESFSGLANKWMIRANAGPPLICGDAVCLPEEECDCPADCGPPPSGAEDDPGNGPVACQDGFDNDCDTLIDCLDADCIGAFPESPGAANCNDGKDNDCDGGFDCNDGDCAAAVNCLTCILSSCPGTAEGEPTCFDGYVDNFNGGCNSTPNIWTVIPAPPIGGSVMRCGESGRHTSPCDANSDCNVAGVFGQVCNLGTGDCSGGVCATDADCHASQTCVASTCTPGQPPRRDTDWYQFVIPPGGDRMVVMCVTAEFEALIGIVDDQGGLNCANAAFISSNVGSGDFACTQVCTDPVCLTAGAWTAYVAPSAGTAAAGVPCGAAYTMELCADVCFSLNTVCNVQAPNQCQLPDAHNLPPFSCGQAAASTSVADTVAATSDANPGADFRVADNFTASAAGNINEVCWWGTYVDFGGTPAPCAGQPVDDFTVTYYNNNAGGSVPGTIKCGPFNVGDVESRLTGLVIGSGAGDLDEYSYTASHANCHVAAGECVWVEVQNNTDGAQTCFWQWSTAPPGDSLGAQHAGAAPYVAGDETDFDLAWCFNTVIHPDGCLVTGACCNDAAATCNDQVSLAACGAAGGRFVANTLCANLAQPCGGGGCCNPSTGACTDVLPASCPPPKQFHLGTFCDSNGGDLICNMSGTCDWNNGPGDLAASAPASQLAPGDFWAEAADNLILKGGATPCEITQIRWWATLFNDVSLDPAFPLCNDGTCSLSGDPCDFTAPQPCPPGEGTCIRSNPRCHGNPDDWASIRVTVYNDEFAPVVTEQFDDTCPPLAIPDGGAPDFGGAPVCTTNADCVNAGLGNLCVDTDFDNMPDSCGVQCDIVVADDPELVDDLDIALVITHTWVGDLTVILERVGAGGVTLIARPGAVGAGFGCPSNNYDIVLDDEGIGGPIEDLCAANASPTPTSPPNYTPNEPLSSFTGVPKEGTWRITVVDSATPDPGTLNTCSLIFNNGQDKGPTGVPEYDIPVGADCTVAQDCIDLGCPADSVCSSLQCRFPVECTNDDDCGDLGPCDLGPGICAQLGTCGFLVPTGSHVPLPGNDASTIKDELIVTPAMWTWAVYGQPVDNAFEITMNVSSLNLMIDQNKKNFIAISPEVPFASFYQTAWMISQNKDGNPAQQVFETHDIFPWTVVDAVQRSDLAFQLIGTKDGLEPCPNDPANNDPTCWDINGNGVRDDRCVWCDCPSSGGICNCLDMATLDAGGPFGACPLDGFCNIHDRTHTLTCFAGANPCSDFAADLGGPFGACPNDGFCNIHDASHALRCFAGTNTCVCPGPSPAPESAPAVVGGAHLTASVSRKAVRPGDEVQVRVYINEALADLQGYELHLGSSGGRRGSLDLVDISIEPTLKGVFGRAANYEAYNIARGQMLNGRESGGVATQANGYLATYTYRVSPDVAGTFVVDVLHDEASNDQTFLVSDFTRKIEIQGTQPASITVVNDGQELKSNR